jgi:light-regulated signal transduction histidine kinase (bacteriophytochrome)
MAETRSNLKRECLVRLNDETMHDLVGPANQIRVMLDLVRHKHYAELSDDIRGMLDIVSNASERMQSMMSGLRAYLVIVGHPQPFQRCDANEILAEARASTQQIIDQNEAVVTHDPLPEIWGDPGQIGSVLASLIANSIKFRREFRPEVHISATTKDGDCLFSVRDNGIGIDGRHTDRIFGLFQRVHQDLYPGAGVGLAVARAVVERHNGRIWVESNPGQGSTFFFILPHSTQAAQDVAQEAEAL